MRVTFLPAQGEQTKPGRGFHKAPFLPCSARLLSSASRPSYCHETKVTFVVKSWQLLGRLLIFSKNNCCRLTTGPNVAVLRLRAVSSVRLGEGAGRAGLGQVGAGASVGWGGPRWGPGSPWFLTLAWWGCLGALGSNSS